MVDLERHRERPADRRARRHEAICTPTCPTSRSRRAPRLYSLEVRRRAATPASPTCTLRTRHCRPRCGRIERRCAHDAPNSAGELRRGLARAGPDPGGRRGAPLVRTHPVTGRKALFLGRRATPISPGCRWRTGGAARRAVGASAKPEFAWYSMARRRFMMWDNRCVITGATLDPAHAASCTAPRSAATGRSPIGGGRSDAPLPAARVAGSRWRWSPGVAVDQSDYQPEKTEGRGPPGLNVEIVVTQARGIASGA